MIYTRFLSTDIFMLGANTYLADVLIDVIRMVADGQEENLTTALLVINESDHYYIDQYLDAPLMLNRSNSFTEDNDDLLFLKAISIITNALTMLIKDNYDLLEYVVEFVKDGNYFDIKGLTEGVNLYYGKYHDFFPYHQGTEITYPNDYR